MHKKRDTKTSHNCRKLRLYCLVYFTKKLWKTLIEATVHLGKILIK